MEIIIKNWDKFSLTMIPDNEIKLVKKNNKDIFIDFNLSNEDRFLINKWVKFSVNNWKIILWYKIKILENIKQNKIIEINNDFNKKISDFNSKYPTEEIKRFSDKLKKAENIISWKKSKYISKLAKVRNITALEMAEKIKEKANLFDDFYIEAENEKYILISKL